MRRNWMPLYIPDFLADTMHLTAAETGAYLCVIMDYWLHDGLPDDDRQLAAVARLPVKSWRAIRPTIQAFFHDGWRHKRIDAELAKMVVMTERRRAAGSKGGTASTIARWNGSSKRQANGQANVEQTAKQNPSFAQAKVKHTTQERITTTCSGAARDGALQQESGSATENEEKPRLSTGSLAEVIAAKGWVK
jgi:uncharacterized protein YdaU (DUF1376 family)